MPDIWTIQDALEPLERSGGAMPGGFGVSDISAQSEIVDRRIRYRSITCKQSFGGHVSIRESECEGAARNQTVAGYCIVHQRIQVIPFSIIFGITK